MTGLAFGPLHALFQTIYEDHFAAQDELAERVKMIGGHAEGRHAVLLARSRLTECDGRIAAEAMIAALRDDQKTLASGLLALADLAERHGDMVTNDLAIERAAVHDKFAWLLGAHLEG